MLFEVGVEVKMRWNTEAFERGAQEGNVTLGRSNDDTHFTERPSRRSLLQDAARDLLHFAFDRWRPHQCNARIGATRGGAFDIAPERPDAIGEIAWMECESDLGVSIECRENLELGIRQRVKSV